MTFKHLYKLIIAYILRPEHRAACPSWPSIAVYPNYIDVTGSLSDPLFKNLRTFIDHWIKQPFTDFICIDMARQATIVLGKFPDYRIYFI